MLGRLMGPGAISANALSQEVGVAQESLSRWLRQSRNIEGIVPASNSKKKQPSKQWTGAEKLRVLTAAHGLSETELGVLLRREGLHTADLADWRTAAEAALSAPGRRAAPSAERRRIQELERELRRKDAALAETAALLVLKKKVQEIWGDEAARTDRRHES
jgi:transposase